MFTDVGEFCLESRLELKPGRPASSSGPTVTLLSPVVSAAVSTLGVASA